MAASGVLVGRPRSLVFSPVGDLAVCLGLRGGTSGLVSRANFF